MENWYGTRDTEDKVSVQGSEKTNTQRYFTEVGRIYDKNNNDYNIEFTPENREKLIQMNLKGVIKIAKAYLGNGMTLDELIAAGNEGLVRAFDRYNPTRSKFAKGLIEDIGNFEGPVPISWIDARILPACEYGSPRKQFDKMFRGPKAKTEYPKDVLIKWVEKNIKNASFNSIAMMWVEAFIRQELTNNSRLIRKPAAKIKEEKEGKSKKEVIIDITQPISEDGNTTFVDTLYIPDDSKSEMEQENEYEYLHDVISKLFAGVKLRDRRIVLKRFGVGYIRPMQPKEISETEHISVARVSQIINITMERMRQNAEDCGIDKEELYEMFNPTEY